MRFGMARSRSKSNHGKRTPGYEKHHCDSPNLSREHRSSSCSSLLPPLTCALACSHHHDHDPDSRQSPAHADVNKQTHTNKKKRGAKQGLLNL